MLSKANRLPSYAIPTVLTGGKRAVEGPLLLMFQKNTGGVSRFAFIVPTGSDKRTTTRNRTRRLLRESVHHQLDHIQAGWDAVIMMKGKLAVDSQGEVDSMVRSVLLKAGLLRI